jgi:peptidoglycan/xylan/chitin deacetylase (PgdA/CDA1 family)
MSSSRRIPVLMYHRIGEAHNPWEKRYCISPALFAKHMRHLSACGMQACSLGDFFAWLDQRKDLPAGSFLLTFDDGFAGIFEHATSILQELGWPATVFLVSQLIGKQDEWCRAENPSGATYPLLDTDTIEAMRGMGFTFHSHTRLHPDLTTLPEDQLSSELHGSRTDLEDLLNEEVHYLAYPYGLYNEQVLAAARAAGYKAAFSTQPGFNRTDIDRFRIRRLDISGTDTPTMLARKIHFGCNDGSWRQSIRYYKGRVIDRLGIRH